ncbi:MAG: peptidase M20, partial [Sphingobium yanoikuyae]|nr:peptidase M20 [Sphingobium yanoikuyae]
MTMSPLSRASRAAWRTLACAGLLSASALAVAATTAPQFDVARIVNDIKILASDEFEGRGPATRAETKTIDYIAKQMAAAGLKPAGDKGTWFQDVPLRMSNITGTPSLSMTVGGAAQPLTQGTEIAVRAAETGQSAVKFANLPLVFVGYGVKAPERGWDDFKGVDLKGKIMVVLVNDPDFEGGEGDFGGKLMTY